MISVTMLPGDQVVFDTAWTSRRPLEYGAMPGGAWSAFTVRAIASRPSTSSSTATTPYRAICRIFFAASIDPRTAQIYTRRS